MKLYLFILLFLVQSSLCYCQKTFSSRAGYGYRWVYQRINNGIINESFYDSVTKLNDSTFKVYNGQLVESNGKVYSNSKMIYNFNLLVGDTFKVNIAGNETPFLVLNKSKVFLDGDSLIRIELKDLKNKVTNIVWVESIGSIQYTRPFDWTIDYNVSDLSYHLNCVLKNDMSILLPLGKDCFACDFFNSSKVWKTWASNNNGDNKFSVVYFYQNQDTTIGGKVYKKMGNRVYARYDSVNRRYYIFGDNRDYLLFNELANVGDTISESKYGTVDIVNSYSIQHLYSQYLKVYKTQNDSFITGIGSIQKVMWHNGFVTFPEFQNGNLCFMFENAVAYNYPDYYRYKLNCDVTNSVQSIHRERIQIYPIPANNLLYLSEAKNYPYSIYDIAGKEMKNGRAIHPIDISDLEKGIYFLKLVIDDQELNYKFIKE